MDNALVIIGLTIGVSILAVGICNYFDAKEWRKHVEHIKRLHDSEKDKGGDK